MKQATAHHTYRLMAKRIMVAKLFFILCGFRLWSADPARSSEGQLGIAEVVSRMAMMDDARLRALKEYSSMRRYTLENARFATFAEVQVRMSYIQPGAKLFEVLSEGGSGLIRKNVLHKLIKTELEASQPDLRGATRIAAENYSFTLVGMGEQDGRRCYILQAVPKVATKYLLVGRLWVDAEDFAVTRIEGSPAIKPSIWIRKTTFVHTYKKVGEFWVPESNNSESDVRIYGRTILKVEYSDYKITTGVSAFPGAVISVGTAPRGGTEQ